MRVMLVIRGVVHFRYLGNLARELAARGHEVLIVEAQANLRPAKQNDAGGALREALEASDLITFSSVKVAQGLNWELAWRLRDIASYSIYFDPRHSSPDLSTRWRGYLPRTVRQVVTRSKLAERVLVSRPVSGLLRGLQNALPASAAARREIAARKPDVVVASPFLVDRAAEVELIKAAKAAGIPTVVPVLSWDNLTTKGTFPIVPDIITVWNKELVQEAVELHRLPADRIVITGAPAFDYMFEMRPSMSREEFCAQVGVDPGEPLVTYLCSSNSIAQDESSYVREFTNTLRGEPAMAKVGVVVRRHPLNERIWEGVEANGYVFWPRSGSWPDEAAAQQNFFDTLYYSAVVIGVNTSAFLDAAIAGTPCLTAITETYRRTQTGRGHFAHLLNADFLEIAATLPEAASIIAAIIRGSDVKAEQRRRFVHEFIRPRGIGRPASAVLAEVIELAARGKTASQIDQALAATPLDLSGAR